jgi:hypothetical protein
MRVLGTSLAQRAMVSVQLEGGAVRCIEVSAGDDARDVARQFALGAGLDAAAAAALERVLTRTVLQAARAEAAFYKGLCHAAAEEGGAGEAAAVSPERVAPSVSPKRGKPNLSIEVNEELHPARVEMVALDAPARQDQEYLWQQQLQQQLDQQHQSARQPHAMVHGEGGEQDAQDEESKQAALDRLYYSGGSSAPSHASISAATSKAGKSPSPSGGAKALKNAASLASAASSASAGSKNATGAARRRVAAKPSQQMAVAVAKRNAIRSAAVSQPSHQQRAKATADSSDEGEGEGWEDEVRDSEEDVEEGTTTAATTASTARKLRANLEVYMGQVDAMSSPRRNNDPATFFS